MSLKNRLYIIAKKQYTGSGSTSQTVVFVYSENFTIKVTLKDFPPTTGKLIERPHYKRKFKVDYLFLCKQNNPTQFGKYLKIIKQTFWPCIIVLLTALYGEL